MRWRLDISVTKIRYLTLNCSKKNGNTGVSCYGCKEPVTGPCYTCSTCNFFLHKTCKDLPYQIYHRFHREHPLMLVEHSPSFGQDYCSFCYKPFGRFFYHCFQCNFNADTKCALSPLCIDDPVTHKHQLLPLLRSESFTCDACGIKCQQSRSLCPILCSICQLVFHKKCTALPHTIRISYDELPLSYNLFVVKKDESAEWNCRICDREVNTAYGCYFCPDCSVVVHVDCARKNSISDKPVVQEDHEAKEIELQKELKVENEDEQGKDKSPIEFDLEIEKSPIEIVHFSHHHNLTLVGKVYDDWKRCDGCIRPISPPLYRCVDCDCDYNLHKSCVDLPKEMSHPIHEHKLFLVPKALRDDGIFYCQACNFFSHGFAYHCPKCIYFYIDVRCASVPQDFDHVSHDHRLHLTLNYYRDCTTCGSNSNSLFQCRRCTSTPFAIDYRCATLPLKVKHKSCEQPYVLTYHPMEWGYCDLCDQDKNPDHWFYYCDNCDGHAHPKCALTDHPYIKLGSIYKFAGLHPHSLKFVLKYLYCLPCDICGEDCKTWSLECTEPNCNYRIHWDCRYIAETTEEHYQAKDKSVIYIQSIMCK